MIAGRPIVLVVEDDHEMNELECELLDLHGFQTRSAYDGRQAVELCRALHPDAVLMDVMLPEMDGFEACRCIRGQEPGAPPVVMLSALDGQREKHTGAQCGAEAFLTKPFDVGKVIGTLKSLV